MTIPIRFRNKVLEYRFPPAYAKSCRGYVKIFKFTIFDINLSESSKPDFTFVILGFGMHRFGGRTFIETPFSLHEIKKSRTN